MRVKGFYRLAVVLSLLGLGYCAWAEPVKRVLSNGMVIVVSPEASARVVSIEAFVKVGVWAEPQERRGIGLLVSRSLFASTTNESLQTLAQEIQRVGGEVRTLWQPDYTQISITTVAEAFDDAAWLLAEVVKNAQFEPEVVQRAKQEALAEVQAERQSRFRSTFTALRSLLYPQGHPYAYAFTGDPEYIRRATPEHLAEFHRQFYTPDNIVIAVAGNIDAGRAVEKFTTLFGSWEAQSARRRPDLRAPAIGEPLSKVREQPGNTAYIMAGYLVPGILSADYPALAVLSAILGEGKSSRIFTNLRDLSGFGYEVGSFYAPLRGSTCLIGFVEVSPYRISASGIPVLIVDEVQQLLARQMQSLRSNLPTEEEVERAKRLVIGMYALRHQRVRDRAYFLGWYEAMGLGYQFDKQFIEQVAALRRDDILRVAERYLRHLGVVVTMPSD